MYLGKLFSQYRHFLVGERLQLDYRREHIVGFIGGKAPAFKPGTQRVVAEYTAPGVLYALRRSAHYYAQVGSFALHDVVVHHQYLFVIVLTGDGMRYLHYIHQFVYHYHEALVTSAHKESRQQLDIVVPVVVGDYDVDAEVLLCFGLGGIFAPEPAHRAGRFFFVAGCVCLVVRVYHAGKIKSVHHVLKAADTGIYLLLNGCVKERVVGAGALGNYVRAHAGYPLLKNERERASVRFCAHAHVPHELAVGCKPLTFGSHQPAFRGKVGVCSHKAPVHQVLAHHLQHEALSAAITPYNKPEERASFFGDVHIVEQRVYLGCPADGNITKTRARHYAAFECIDYSRCYALWYCHCHFIYLHHVNVYLSIVSHYYKKINQNMW